MAFVVIALILGVNPLSLLAAWPAATASYAPPATQTSRAGAAPGAAADPETQFVSRVLKSTEDVWGQLFQRHGPAISPAAAGALSRRHAAPPAAPASRRWGRSIARPTSGSISTSASSTSWRRRFRAPGQFPQAYVIAHEIGHHVQNLLGITGKVEQMRQSMSKRDANAMSVRVELQADCFAGVWAYHADQERGGTA